jgi:hypothetical protein
MGWFSFIREDEFAELGDRIREFISRATTLSRNDAVEDSGTDDFGQDLQDSQD